MSTPANPLRRIEPVSISGLKPKAPATGQPIMEYVNPRSLYIDPAYQRSIGERGLRQIRKIIEHFDWSKFKLPTCCYSENHAGETVLFVLDGQHTAIACASHPHIDTIPVQIVEAATVEAQAAAFIGLNTERLGVTSLQLHQAAVAAGDKAALKVVEVCQRATVSILRGTPGSGKFKSHETVAVQAIGGLIARRGEEMAGRVLDVLSRAQLAPITGPHIKAVDLLLTDEEYCQSIDDSELVTAIISLKTTGEDEAKVFAAAHKVPIWKALAITWFKKCRKRRLKAVA
ncbi:hypothetical protein [Mesorhizobium temperatum]|uniref:ParB/Sulfiredoxin domain-containing protein n=1 Tax=Mesorhizobium temperatum TaxID=241416 RepID=A0A271LQM8_9HYPH|nr:hypothetical protein [Mesorhizobium temperatum]PAQ09726.1 hypothetical protein CIT26_11845 [Mesorhizobium temperatum]